MHYQKYYVKRPIKPLILKPRPKGLGLGAKPEDAVE